MSEISRAALFGRLGTTPLKAVETATSFCKMRGNPYVELVHWMVQLVQNNETDLDAILRHYQIDASAMAKDMTAALDRLPRGSTAISDFSELIENSIDAKSRSVAVTPGREGGRHYLSSKGDGEGVPRDEAGLHEPLTP